MTTPLRPMSLSELLDRSFFLYRRHFVLFVGIVAVPYLVLFATQLIGIALPSSGLSLARTILWPILVAAVYLGVLAAAQGATVIAVSRVHLGYQTDISQSFAGIKSRILELAMIMLGVGMGTALGFILLIVPGIILMLMWSLAIPVAVLEDTGLRNSVERSAELTKGSRGRILTIYFLFVCLTYIVTILWDLPVLAASGVFAGIQNGVRGAAVPVWTQVALAAGNFFTECLVAPLLTISLALVYYDQRVRKEAFDLQLMMSNLDVAEGATPAPTAI